MPSEETETDLFWDPQQSVPIDVVLSGASLMMGNPSSVSK